MLSFPAGRIESKDIDLTIKLDKAYEDVDNYKNLPLKRAKDGSIITLSDVSRIELGAESTRTIFKGNGKQVVGIGIYQQSDANTIAVANGIKEKMRELEPSLPPGTTLEVSFDRSNYIKTAIKEVYKTLINCINSCYNNYIFIFRKFKSFNSSFNSITSLFDINLSYQYIFLIFQLIYLP